MQNSTYCLDAAWIHEHPHFCTLSSWPNSFQSNLWDFSGIWTITISKVPQQWVWSKNQKHHSQSVWPSPLSQIVVTSCHDYPLTSSTPNSACRWAYNNPVTISGKLLYRICISSFCQIFSPILKRIHINIRELNSRFLPKILSLQLFHVETSNTKTKDAMFKGDYNHIPGKQGEGFFGISPGQLRYSHEAGPPCPRCTGRVIHSFWSWPCTHRPASFLDTSSLLQVC
jgi:hypothetical protein